jgi:hypothetical protein
MVAFSKKIWIRIVGITFLAATTGFFCLGCGSRASTQPVHAEDAQPLGTVGASNYNTLSQWIDRSQNSETGSAMPAAAEDCAMIYDPLEHRIVLFGGKNDEDVNLSEVWELALTTHVWKKIEVEGESPPASEDHSVIYDPLNQRMIVYGGENGPTTNSLWSFDLKAHRWRDMTDSTVQRREDHTANFDSRSKRMLVFGGRDRERINLHELWAMDLDPRSPAFEKWQNLTVEENHAPGRYDHVAVYDSLKNRLVIYGGYDKDNKECLGDTWAFYFSPFPNVAGKWKQVKTQKSHPPKRRRAAAVYDATRNWFVVCGGFGEEGYLNDVWAFDLTYDVWLDLTPGPPPRIDHQAVYDPRAQRMIVYGGDARLSEKFHDVWELSIYPYPKLDQMLKVAGAKLKKFGQQRGDEAQDESEKN